MVLIKPILIFSTFGYIDIYGQHIIIGQINFALEWNWQKVYINFELHEQKQHHKLEKLNKMLTGFDEKGQ